MRLSDSAPDVILRSHLLAASPGLVFAMGFRPAGDAREQSSDRDRERLFRSTGTSPERAAIPRQVHSDVVRIITQPGIYPNCDALMTVERDVFLSVAVADCVPIFLHDRTTGAVAAVHAGWRGSKDRILGNALERLKSFHGASVSDVVAYLGPSAGVCCYEVGEEVARAFGPAFVWRREGSKPHLDLRQFNVSLLLDAGVPESNIEQDRRCTICDPARFPSYRRDGRRAGRMWGLIGRKAPR